MKPIPSAFSGAGLAVLLSLSSANAVVAPVYTVSATDNINSAGFPAPIDPGGSGAGALPVGISVMPGQTAFQFSAAGSITEYIYGGVYHGPDGRPGIGCTVLAYGGLSGFLTDQTVPLAGVFLTEAAPQDPAPPTLDFTAAGLGQDFTTLSPLIGQVFFIGDGRTTGNITQTFNVPAGATRLFLGCPDSPFGYGLPGAFDDNAGTLSVSVMAVPEPSVGMLGFSAAVLLTVRGRKTGTV